MGGNSSYYPPLSTKLCPPQPWAACKGAVCSPDPASNEMAYCTCPIHQPTDTSQPTLKGTYEYQCTDACEDLRVLSRVTEISGSCPYGSEVSQRVLQQRLELV